MARIYNALVLQNSKMAKVNPGEREEIQLNLERLNINLMERYFWEA